MAALPTIVRVGPYRYGVRADHTSYEQMCRESRPNEMLGEADHEKQTITLSPLQGPDALAETLLHEVLHCVFYAAGRSDHGEAQFTGEEAIRIISPGLLDALRRNPDLASYLLATD